MLLAECIAAHRRGDGHGFAVAQDLILSARFDVLKGARHVVLRHDVDLQSVLCEDDVAGEEDVGLAVDVVDLAHHGEDLSVCGEIYRDDEDGAEEVEQRSREHHDEPFPGFLTVERDADCPRFGGVSRFFLPVRPCPALRDLGERRRRFAAACVDEVEVVFAEAGVEVILAAEGAEPSERQYAYGEELPRLFVAFFYDRRTEAYAEFVDGEAEHLARKIVPRLMNDDHEHQGDQCQQDVAYIGENLTRTCGSQREQHFI